jgi:4-amino-4-deoxy-L-arabinose transferase-like glycosyltransferase
MNGEKPGGPYSWRAQWGVHLLVVVFLALGITYGLTIPPFESPDEPFHLNTVRYIAVHRALPPRVMPDRRLMTGADVARSLEYAETRVFYAPPLYYSLGAILVSWTDMRDLPRLLVPNPTWEKGWSPVPGTDPWNKNFYARVAWGITGETIWALYLLRLFSLGLGVVTVLSTYALARRLWPDRPMLSLGAAALVALNPQFIALSAGVTNDNLLIALCTLFFAHTVSCIQNGTKRQWALLGGFAGLTLLTKQSGWLLLPTGVLAALMQQVSWRQRFRNAGLFLSIALTIGLWWYVRGAVLYGDPMGFGPHVAGQNPLARFGLREAWTCFQTYWAAFGWGLILVDRYVYWCITGLLGAGLLGLLFAFRPGGLWWCLPPAIRRGMALLALAFGLNAAALVRWAMATGAPFGRLLFPTIAPVAILTAYGLAQWARWKGCRWMQEAGLIAAIAFNACIPWRFIRPAFTYSRPLRTAPATLQPVHQAFQNGIQLLGYEVSQDPLQAGRRASLILYWYTPSPPRTRYWVSVQLGPQDPSRHVAGEDVWLGGTLYPSDLWRAGDIVRQIHRLSIPDWAPAPGLYWLRIGVYSEETGRIPLQDGPGDMVVLGPWRLLPAGSPPAPACVTDYRLGDAIQLKGYDLAWEQEGDQRYLAVTLHWQAVEEVGADYTVFVHLLDGKGHLVAQHDGPPRGGEYPTSWWRVGEQVPDPHQLSLERLLEGSLSLRVGMYHPETLERLPAYDGNGRRLKEDIVALSDVLSDGHCGNR